MALIDKLTAIGDAIREKNGTTELIPLVDMPQAIRNIQSGGNLEVEYIESTGTQWIDTGIIPTNHRVAAKFQYTYKINNYPSLFGMWSTEWDKDYYLTWGNNTNKWYYASGMSYEGIISNATQCTDLQEIDFNNYEGKFLINGVEYGDTNGEVNALYTLPIFTRRNNNGGYTSVYNCSARLYYFKIYDRATQELVRDFVPAVDENGIVCLYDKVTEAYFYNQGSGEFEGNFIEKGLTELETLIDESGVLDSTEGTVTEKVEELIDKAAELNVFMHITNASQLFYQAKSFPSKAVVNLPNVTSLYQAFSYWNTEPIPIVEELIINAPNIVESSSSANGVIAQMFAFNNGVKKVVFNMSNGIQKMGSLFSQAKAIEEIVLNFSTKNVTVFSGVFSGSTVRKIIGALDFSSATSVNNILTNCLNLEEVTFAPNTLSLSISLANSSKLSANSVRSIIDGLNSEVTGQTLTLTKTAVNKAFETSEGANNGSTDESSEWFNLIATRTNWTITLS